MNARSPSSARSVLAACRLAWSLALASAGPAEAKQPFLPGPIPYEDTSDTSILAIRILDVTPTSSSGAPVAMIDADFARVGMIIGRRDSIVSGMEPNTYRALCRARVTVTLWASADGAPSYRVGQAERRIEPTVTFRYYPPGDWIRTYQPVWVVERVDVSAARELNHAIFFYATVEGPFSVVDSSGALQYSRPKAIGLSSVWRYAQAPARRSPIAKLDPPEAAEPGAVDTHILSVEYYKEPRHPGAETAEGYAAITVGVTPHGSLASVPPEWDAPLTLNRTVNEGPAGIWKGVATKRVIPVPSGDSPAWVFEDYPSRENFDRPLPERAVWATVDTLPTYPALWSLWERGPGYRPPLTVPRFDFGCREGA